MSLNQLQFAGMPAAQPRSVGEKSRPAPAPVEPHGETVKGFMTDDPDEHPTEGRWAYHEDVGAGIKHINDDEYTPEIDYTKPGKPYRAYEGDSWGRPAEVAIQSARGPHVYSHQPAVSLDRVAQLHRAPHTSGAAQGEAPYVTVNPLDEVLVEDGNHRMTAALQRNEMFQPAHVTRIR